MSITTQPSLTVWKHRYLTLTLVGPPVLCFDFVKPGSHCPLEWKIDIEKGQCTNLCRYMNLYKGIWMRKIEFQRSNSRLYQFGTKCFSEHRCINFKIPKLVGNWFFNKDTYILYCKLLLTLSVLWRMLGDTYYSFHTGLWTSKLKPNVWKVFKS